MPARRRDPLSMPRVIPRSYGPSKVRHDYGIDDSITRAGYLSNAVLEDTYDAAARSRGKDHELLRSANSAIRPSSGLGLSSSSSSSRIGGHHSHPRFRSLPPSRDRSASPTYASSLYSKTSPSPVPPPTRTSTDLVPYRSPNAEKLRAALTPSPNSLLSNRISAFLRGGSVPPAGLSSSSVGYKSYLDSASPPRPSRRDDASSIVSYKSYLSDPSITSPFSTRSSTRRYKGYELPSHGVHSSSQPYRASSVPHYEITLPDDDDNDYENDEEVASGGGYRVGDYRRKYGRGSSTRPNVLYYSTGSPEGSDVEDDETYTPPSRSGTYSLPRPSGAPSRHLSSYDAPYDGSYEADMAEMYDYVPFGPSTQGILELTQHDGYNDDDDSNDLQPSILPSSSSSTLSIPPSLSPSSSLSLSRTAPPPSVSLIPHHTSRPALGELTTPSSLSQSPVFESVLANTAARARAALKDTSLPYKDASLVLSLEGSAVSEDGKNRYGFRYYPPPIPLKGSGVGLDERLLGIAPQAHSPADAFLGGYISRLRNLHSDLENQADRRGGDGVACGRSVIPRSLPPPLPSNYSHHTVHMPLHIAGRAQSVPVSSYTSQLDDRGAKHRLDVFPLVETHAHLPKGALQLPLYKPGRGGEESPSRLSVIDKINIKVSTELHSTPRAAVVSRKVRASSVPPVSAQPRVVSARPTYPKVAGNQPTIVLVPAPYPVTATNNNINTNTMPVNVASRPVVLRQSESPWYRNARAGSMPPRPRSVAVDSAASYEAVGTEGLKAHNPMLIRQMRARSVGPVSASGGTRAPFRAASTLPRPSRGPVSSVNAPLQRAKVQDIGHRINQLVRSVSEPRDVNLSSYHYPVVPDVRERALNRYLYAHRGRYGADSRPPKRSLGDFPLVYVPHSGPGPSNRAKAAIIGSKMEAEDGGKKRRPRSNYAAAKYREARKEHPQEAVFYNTINTTGGYHSSRPPLPKPTERKSIRDVDGFTKPKNVMSWQYRVESRLSPDDLMDQPPSLSRMRTQLRDAHEKIDRHRQLLDRYLDKDTVAAATNRKDATTTRGGFGSVKIPDYYAAGGDPKQMPMSDLRRRIRRTIAKAKNNADYYRE